MKKIKFFLLILLLVSNCTSPIEKKKKELQNLKIKLSKVIIRKYNIILLPPLPKIYFDVFLEVQNTNEESVSIEKLNFQILKNYNNQENILIANAKTPQTYELAASETKEIKLEMITNLEENKEKKVYTFVGDIIKALIKNEEIEFVLDGHVEYDTLLGKINLPFSQVFKAEARP
jgi:hypothetical protein